ncbi:membrane-associated protein, putative [Bodo saltans]|uniref:Membrane-associated protein, putative n=1 Tax=Bodo saltans TaxID=75058 RepID=A0A0S4JQZ1_BODSA|nr:membrane-associated protein, putative [Bodo saltans]|eukprot:CUG92617.1 membrane-associated protein, putative [Bodo saltans]
MFSRNDTTLPATASLLLLLLLAVLGVVSAQPLERPSLVKLGMYYDMTSPEISFDGVQIYAGAQAAVKELNDNNVVPGVAFELEYIPAFSTCRKCIFDLPKM